MAERSFRGRGGRRRIVTVRKIGVGCQSSPADPVTAFVSAGDKERPSEGATPVWCSTDHNSHLRLTPDRDADIYLAPDGEGYLIEGAYLPDKAERHAEIQ